MVSGARMKFDAEHLRIAEQVRKGAKGAAVGARSGRPVHYRDFSVGALDW